MTKRRKVIVHIGTIGPLVARLREQPGKDIWLMGGGEIIASFLDELWPRGSLRELRWHMGLLDDLLGNASQGQLMKADADHRLTVHVLFVICILSASAATQGQAPAASPLATRAEREAFLSNARIVTDAPADERSSWRISLDDGTLKHDASVETADGSDPTRRNYRFNLAAYELDKALGLNLVPPSVERVVSGRPASVIWWVDNVVMNELDRRRKRINPPDLESWSRQVQAVRVFDELISNTYRDTSPALYLNTVWDNLLITGDWTVWIIDHTGAFRTRKELLDPESLTRCPRNVLDRLRAMDRERLQRTLGKYLSSQQLDTLDVRRTLLVRHFDAQIASKGEAAVLFDLTPRR
jgi:hypothetical protein